MDTGCLIIGQIHRKLLQFCLYVLVHLIEEILRAAAHIQLGQSHASLDTLVQQGKDIIVAAADRRITEDIGKHHRRGSAGRGLFHQSGDVQSAGHADRTGKTLGVFQCQTVSTVTAHGNTGDEGILPTGGHGEHSIDKGGQFLGHIGHESGTVGHIHVAAVGNGCTDYDQLMLLGIPLDAGIPCPDSAVTKGAVEQVQDLILLTRLIIGCRIRMERFIGRGNHHTDIGIGHQRCGEKLDVKKCHDTLPFL